MQVVWGLSENTLPGDVLGVSPRHPPVTESIDQRMASIIRERSLVRRAAQRLLAERGPRHCRRRRRHPADWPADGRARRCPQRR